MKNKNRESIAAQALGWIDEKTKGVVEPIYTSTTFIRDPGNQKRINEVGIYYTEQLMESNPI